MSVYTSVSDEQIQQLLDSYSLGTLISNKDIAQGITNSNYFLTTTAGNFILTIFEKIKQHELPFFLLLKEHLHRNNILCPMPIARKDGRFDSILADKPACVVTCLNGSDTDCPSESQCFQTGAMLAKMHLAGQNFPLRMNNPRYKQWWHDSSNKLLAVLSDADTKLLQSEILYLDKNSNTNLPSGIIHADLFKDNVLFDNGKITGFIDFYYACNGSFIYDIAIAVNDWARIAENQLDSSLERAFLRGYTDIRLLSKSERDYYPIAKRAGCIRFWVSRLLDFHFPQTNGAALIKDPNIFRDLLLSYR